jgi:hypothetical protein
MAAQSNFKDIAKLTSYTLLDDTDLATVPVSGQDTAPSGEIDRDLGAGSSGADRAGTSPGATLHDTSTPSGTGPGIASPPSTSPDTTSTPGDLSRPSPTSPDRTGSGSSPTDSERSKGQTMPGSKSEPVKQAPAGGQ